MTESIKNETRHNKKTGTSGSEDQQDQTRRRQQNEASAYAAFGLVPWYSKMLFAVIRVSVRDALVPSFKVVCCIF